MSLASVQCHQTDETLSTIAAWELAADCKGIFTTYKSENSHKGPHGTFTTHPVSHHGNGELSDDLTGGKDTTKRRDVDGVELQPIRSELRDKTLVGDDTGGDLVLITCRVSNVSKINRHTISGSTKARDGSDKHSLAEFRDCLKGG